ncbi:MAG: DUF2868 domain-containing protein [Desulfobacterales bacterium]
MKWRVPDIIDFEYLLRERFRQNLDGATGDADRQIYQAFIQNHPDMAEKPESIRRKDLFRYWLSRKREEIKAAAIDPAVLPGEAAAETLGLIRWITGIFGILFGAGLCGSLLAYAGDDPINIFSCLWVMIAPQLILLLLLGASSLFRKIAPGISIGGVYPLLIGIFRRFINKLINSRYNALSAERRTRIEAVIGMIGQSRTIYGQILCRPVFIIGQIFGICFNAGIIGVLLLRVTITDLAFGWQSTLQPAGETVYRIVDTIALPWSWFLPEAIAHPTIAQIEGSQFVLKQGMQHLNNADLVAWWPFLLLAVLFYGLIPRLLIFTATVIRQHRTINRLSFKHAACDQLLSAMKTPRITTRSRAYKKPGEEPSDADSGDGSGATKSAKTSEAALDPAAVMIPEDLAGLYPDDELRERIQIRLGLDMKTAIICGFDPDADARAVKENLPADSKPADIRLVIIQEAWQPPIQETLSWIGAIRQKTGIQTSLIIGLIGKPGAHTIFTPPADTDRMIWEHAIAKLGDPYIRVEILGE